VKREALAVAMLSLVSTSDRTARAASDQPALRQVQTIPLPGVQGRIDHLAVDVAGQKLFVAALGNDTVEVIDLKKGERIRSLAGFKEPQGLAYLPDTNTVAVANGGDGTVALVDGVTFRSRKTIALGDDADNLRYDPTRKRLYVGYADGALGILDPVIGSRLGDVTLDAHPESFQVEASSSRAYVNVASRQTVAVVDVDRMAVVATWPVSAGSANYPMALDGLHHRLFVATRRPPHVVVFDTTTGRTVATLEADGDADDLFYDGSRQRLYGCFGAGSVMVYAQSGADHYEVLARVPTAAGARTGLFSADLRRLFVAVPRRATSAAEIRVFDTGR